MGGSVGRRSSINNPTAKTTRKHSGVAGAPTKATMNQNETETPTVKIELDGKLVFTSMPKKKTK